MKAWLWGLVLFITGLFALAITYGSSGSLKTVIPFLDYIGFIEAAITAIGFFTLAIGLRSWHK